MKQNVFNLNVARAHLERNAFDLSHNDVFSCAPGQLLPISCTEVLPNEHYEINPQIFLRTMPLNSAAFVRMRQHVEFFFVPMRVLCRQFNQFVVGTKYPSSSIDSLNGYQGVIPSAFYSVIKAALSRTTQSDLMLDGLGVNIACNGVRLLDLLGYGITSLDSLKAIPDTKSPSVSLLRLAAYQKVYSDFYRNPYYEGVEVSSFNLDNLYNQPLNTPSAVNINRLRQLLTLRYRNWSKDYFTSVQPQFQGAPFVTNSVNMSNLSVYGVDGEGNSIASTLMAGTSDANFSASNLQSGKVSSLVTNATISDLSDLEYLNIPVHNIRAAFALDKLLRLQQQAGNGSYCEQIRNRFGAAGVHDDWKATYLGGSSSPVSISEVITTANTSDKAGDAIGQTGDIYGKASSVNDARIVFDSKEHGIILGIFSVVPDADYNSTGVDAHNLKHHFEDFFQPEFDRLGKQPLSAIQLSFLKPFGFPSSTDWVPSTCMGFQNRYMEYKVGIDKVHGEFCTMGSLSAWTSPRNTGLLMTQDVDKGGKWLFNLYSLKVSPKILNSITSIQFNGEYLNTDPILVDSHIGIKAIRPMSVSGEPLLS